VAGRSPYGQGAAVRRRLVRRPSWSSASRGSARRISPACGLELRQAIEPWHVLGEEASQRRDGPLCRFLCGASAGFGDRPRGGPTCGDVQRRPGADGARGEGLGDRRRPGSGGAFVGGVRYRAWAPWSALHPTIGVHSPLIFDLVDRWNARSLGGFTYHVTHPAGSQLRGLPGQCGRGGVPSLLAVHQARAQLRTGRHRRLAGRGFAGSPPGRSTPPPLTCDDSPPAIRLRRSAKPTTRLVE
jgi:hypothetical protein